MNSFDSADTVELPVGPGHAAKPLARTFSSMASVDIGALSHPGLVRPSNEDHFLVVRFGRFFERLQNNLPDDAVPARSDEIGYAMAVADGMGGHVGGEVASRLAISTLVELALDTPDWILQLKNESYIQEVLARARERYGMIKTALAEEAERNPRLSSFGTTLTLASSAGKHLFLAHIGDSRAYLLRHGQLQRLTRDHTLAQELADAGGISFREVAKHRLRHVLTKSLGPQCDRARPDVQHIILESEDRLLLCSDGLSEMVPDDQIAVILGLNEPASKICERLIGQALQAGGKDNVTAGVVIYRFPAEA